MLSCTYQGNPPFLILSNTLFRTSLRNRSGIRSVAAVIIGSSCLINRQLSESFIRIGLGISLGHESELLPESAINALVTAEMLYQEYANEEYAVQGFDYSGISALYYQAFEEAYNQRVWKPYVKKLKEVVISGRNFTKILKLNYSDIKKFYGDFDEYLDIKSLSKYTFENKEKRKGRELQPSITYGPFAILMDKISKNELPRFSEFFADVTGFRGTEEMLGDCEFMKSYDVFVYSVKKSIDFRNHASHGSERVDLAQCESDKKRIVSDLEEVRKSSIGLIQQLLCILAWNRKKETHGHKTSASPSVPSDN